MYFGLSPQKSEIWVGDRGNSRLVILKLSGRRITPDGYIETPEGLFHSMITQVGSEPYPIVWNTCDIANVTVVYDLTSRRKLAQIPLPPEVAALGGVPHDITANSDYGFVTYINNADGAGYIASYSARTFELIQLRQVALDPHIAIRDSTKLTVAAQGGEVLLLSIPDLRTLNQDLSQPSPHGTIITFNSKFLYVTNIAEMGENAVVTYDTSTLQRVNCPIVTTSNPVPHNPATNLDGSRIFITHSGATSDIVSAFDIADDGCVMRGSEQIVRTGLNPFGLFVLPPSQEEPICKVRRVRVY
ncbi:Nitrous oxide reductase [Gracilaria domingensis]|nr:Nitrous oxide reductase [Gracilaria domingensis]